MALKNRRKTILNSFCKSGIDEAAHENGEDKGFNASSR